MLKPKNKKARRHIRGYFAVSSLDDPNRDNDIYASGGRKSLMDAVGC